MTVAERIAKLAVACSRLTAIYHAARAALGIEAPNDRLRTGPFLGTGSVAVTRFRFSAASLCAIAGAAP